MKRQIDRQKDRQTDRQIERQTDRQTGERKNIYIYMYYSLLYFLKEKTDIIFPTYPFYYMKKKQNV